MLKNDIQRKKDGHLEVIQFLNKNVSELIKAYDQLTAKDQNIVKSK